MKIAFLFALLATTAESFILHDDLHCNEASEVAALDLNVGSDPSIGWILTCDGEILWEVPAGSLNVRKGTWVKESSCVAKTTSCQFTLSANGEATDTFFSLIYGATTIAVSEHGAALAVTTSHCFGPDCSEVPLERQEEDQSPPKSGSYIDNRSTESNGKRALVVITIILSMVIGIAAAWCFFFVRRRSQVARREEETKIKETKTDEDDILF